MECRINLPYRTYRPSHLNGYGLILAQLKPYYAKRRDKLKFLDVKGYIDLQQVLWPYGDMIKVIDLSTVFGTLRLSGGLEIPAEQIKFKGFSHDLFKVENGNILAIFLVYDPAKNLLQQSFMPAFSNSRELMQFIKTHKIDSVVMRGSQGPEKSDLMMTELGVESEKFITDNNNDIYTVSKCKSYEEPFNHNNYKFGVKSPGM